MKEAILFCGRKNSSKTTTGSALADQLGYKLMDCGLLFQKERELNTFVGMQLNSWYKKVNFFEDRHYQGWSFDVFTELGGYNPQTVNVGMPRSVFQYKLVENYAKRNDVNIKIVHFEIDDETFRRRHEKRIADGTARDFDNEIEKALALDQQFRVPVEKMVNYMKQKNPNFISIPTYETLNGQSVDRSLDDYLPEVLNFIKD